MSGLLNQVTLAQNLRSIAKEEKEDPFFKAKEKLSHQEVDFPQNHCVVGKWTLLSRLNSILQDKLSSKHPFFKPVNDKIKGLKALGKSLEAKTVINAYQKHIEEVCDSTGKMRLAAIKGRAHLLSSEGFFRISQELARRLASINSYGEISKSNEYGASAVFFYGGIHFKRPTLQNIDDPTQKGQERQLLPLCPGLEFTVHSLDEILHTFSVISPVTLIKVSNIWFKQVFHPSSTTHPAYQSMKNLVGHGSKAVIGDYFKTHPELKIKYPFALEKKHVVIQASHTIKGVNLREFLENGQINKIDITYFGQLALLHMILTPWDARSDNLMAQPLENGLYKIVGIDNDGILSDPYIWSPFSKQHFLKLLSILFVFPQMSQPVCSRLIKRYSKINPEEAMMDWMHSLHQKNRAYQVEMGQWGISQEEQAKLSLPIKLNFLQVFKAYQRLTLVKQALSKKGVTYWDVLETVYPEIYPVYKKLASQSSSPLEAQKLLWGSSMPLHKYLTEKQLSKLERKTSKPQLMDTQALAEKMIPKLAWKEMPAKVQKNLLFRIVAKFPELKRLHLIDLKISAKEIEETIQHSNCSELILENCSTVTPERIFRILTANKKIDRLILKEYLHLKPEQFKEVVKFCWENGKRLSIQPMDHPVDITQEKLHLALETTLDGERIEGVKYVVALGANLKRYRLQHFLTLCAKGCDRSIAFLLDNKAEQEGGGGLLSSLDNYGKGAVHYAVSNNRVNTVSLLIKRGADPLLVDSNEKQNILHIAALYGFFDLIKTIASLIGKVKFDKLASGKDVDGKTPLHKAVWGPEKAKIIAFLIDQGADVNAENYFNYTALHWAAKHGHLKSGQLLLSAGAKVDTVNRNGDMPFDLAIGWSQESMIRLFLGLKEQPKPKEDFSFVASKHYEKLLHQAIVDKNPLEQVLSLLNLSNLDVNNGRKYLQAAQRLNAALALLQKTGAHVRFARYLFGKLERVEGLFLESQGLKVSSSHRGYTEKLREMLSTIRQGIDPNHPRTSLDKLSQGYGVFFNVLVKNAVEMCGKPPCRYTFLQVGQQAEGLMLPFGTFQFAILVENEEPATLHYFRRLLKLLEIKIVNLGETPYSIEKDPPFSPTRDGLRLGQEGTIPFIKGNRHDLIGTPNTLMGNLNLEGLKNDAARFTLLCFPVQGIGDKKLYRSYLQLQKSLLKPSFFGEKVYIDVTRALLKTFIPTLESNLKQNRQKGLDFQKDLYEPIRGAILALAIYYGIVSRNPFKCIEELAKKKKISSSVASHLKKVLSTILKMAMLSNRKEGSELSLIPEFEKALEAIVPILLSLIEVLKRFSAKPDSVHFRNFGEGKFRD